MTIQKLKKIGVTHYIYFSFSYTLGGGGGYIGPRLNVVVNGDSVQNRVVVATEG